MSNFQIKYNHPWLLLLIIPALLLTLIPYFRLEKKYRFTRNRIISMTLHTVALVLAINLLAGLAFSYEVPNEQNEVILLVDASDSVTDGDSTADFVSSVIDVCPEDCRIGIVKFGYGCKYAVELTSDRGSVYASYASSDNPDGTATSLADALKYTSSLFTNPKTAKIVIVSDGRETDGDALSVIRDISEQGTVIDVAPVKTDAQRDVQIVSAEITANEIIPGESFVVELLVRSNATDELEAAVLRLYDNGTLYGESYIGIKNGDNEIPVSLTIPNRGLHELTFEIVTDYEEFGDPLDDAVKVNNFYHTYVNLEQFKNILLIERYEGESLVLKSILSETKAVTDISVEMDAAAFPKTVEEMAKYEQVVLVNIAYSDMPVGFEALLHRYVYELGGGLFTVGGMNPDTDSQGNIIPHAYNRDDIEKSTYFKEMLPVKAENYTPPIAAMIVIDTSTSMRGNNSEKLYAAVDGAKACLDALHDRDFCGVISFSDASSERISVLPVTQREAITEAINKVKEDKGGGTMFSGAIDKAGRALSVINNVERKHIILVTDGLPGDSYDDYASYIANNLADGITISVVTIGLNDTSNQAKMQQIADAGGGKYYNVTDVKSLSKKMYEDLTEEAIPEIAYGEEFALVPKDRSPILTGIDTEAIPKLSGYYGTTPKKDATVVLMGEYVPIYASRKYGKGTVGSFMCDLGCEWSSAFVTDIVGKTIIMNIVESIFPFEDVRADGVKYELKSDNYSNWLNVHGIPDGHSVRVTVTPVSAQLQTLGEITVKAAESNRRFTFSLTSPGLYRIVIRVIEPSGAVTTEIPIYKSFSYSEEYDTFSKEIESGEELLSAIAEKSGGVTVDDPAYVFATFTKTLTLTYDPKVILIICAIALFLLDITVRKFKFKWIHELVRERKYDK